MVLKTFVEINKFANENFLYSLIKINKLEIDIDISSVNDKLHERKLKYTHCHVLPELK